MQLVLRSTFLKSLSFGDFNTHRLGVLAQTLGKHGHVENLNLEICGTEMSNAADLIEMEFTHIVQTTSISI